MKRMITQRFLTLFAFLFAVSMGYSQILVKGTIIDGETGDPLIGANVSNELSGNGASTDANGKFRVEVKALPAILTVSYVGYDTESISVNQENDIVIRLFSGVRIDDVIIVGSRFRPRTVITSPVPIDNVKMDELIRTGKTQFDKMLSYSVPSYNSTQQTISDATAHFDPGELRGLGPSRTLVLINGKRKNASSLVYINDTPGKGEVGVDMKSIPAAAIYRCLGPTARVCADYRHAGDFDRSLGTGMVF